MTTTAQMLRQFIIDNFLFGQCDTPLSDEDSFLDNGIIDSTGVLELVSFVEGALGITIDDDELVPDNLDSIRKLLQFIERKQHETALPA